MSLCVELSVVLRDGTEKRFTKSAGQSGKLVDMKTLQQSLSVIQKDTNAYLTDLVEQEKQVTNSNGNPSQKQHDHDDDDEDDQDEDKEKDIQPSLKKRKR